MHLSIRSIQLQAALIAGLLVAFAAHAADDPLHELIELLDDRSPDALAQAESIYGQLTKDGAPNVKGAYSLALVCTREGKLDRAIELLGALPNEAKLISPILRLRLWLSLERDETEIPERLLKVVREQIANTELAESERLEAARLLGGIAGAIPTGAPPTLSASLIDQTVTELTTAADQKTSALFRSTRQAALKRRQQLSELVGEVKGDKEAGKKTLADAETEKPNADASLNDAEAALKAKIVANRAEEKKASPQARTLGRQATALRRDWKLATPGQPSAPKRPSDSSPTQPRLPSRDSKGNVSQADQERYDSALRQYHYDSRAYQAKLFAYHDAVRTYPARLAAWQTLDKQRRDGLRSQMNTVQEDLSSIKTAEMARDAEADQLRQNASAAQTAARDLDLKIRLLRTVIAAEDADDSLKMLAHPSSYDLLSFPAERQRLLKWTQ